MTKKCLNKIDLIINKQLFYKVLDSKQTHWYNVINRNQGGLSNEYSICKGINS